jgi:bifunctional N-acetylglucosamine-1-phosphate-uridyltransferase/glucosamine-1-phosphate-acetyltransferase GlmU-like protein
VLREADGSYKTIVEQADATPEQLAIREVNPSYYCFNSGALFAGLKQVNNKNRQGEYYLTDVPALLKKQGKRVSVVDAVPAEDVLSINTPQQLDEVSRVLENRLSAAGKRGDA